MEVELPDGTIAEFPDSMTQQQIEGVLAKQIPVNNQKQSYLEQFAKGSPVRQREMQRIFSQYSNRQITAPEAAIQTVGEYAGNLQDVTGRAIGDVVGGAYRLLPEKTQTTVAENLAPIGKAITPTIQKIGGYYSKVKEKYPRATENVEAVTNIGMLAAPMLSRSEKIAGSVERAGTAIKGKFLPKPKALSSEELKSTAGQLYKIAEQKGGILKPEITNKFIDDVLSEVPQTDMGKVVIGDTPVSKLTERIGALRDRPMTLQSAQEIDEALGDLAYGNMNAITGKLDKQGTKFLNIQSKFRDAIENAPENMVIGGKEGFNSLKDARNYWGTSLRLADIEKAISKGLSTEQPQTGIKNAFKSLLNSKKIKNYSPVEVQAIKQAANKGVLTDILGTMGSRLNPQLLGVGVGVATQDPAAALMAFAAQTAASSGARTAATAMQLKKARYVEDLIRQRVGAGSMQKMKLTPEIQILARELGIASIPGGSTKELLNELQNIQQTGTISSQEQK